MRPARFVTAASLFDGHDASINIIRRVLQDQGAEVIHLGHNRSAEEIIDTAIQEDADGIAVSSYQGGHNEFFRFMHDLLQEKGAPWIRIFGGGGGVIIPAEIAELHDYGIERIYSPEEGRDLGLEGMAKDMLARCGSLDGNLERGERLPQRISRIELGESKDTGDKKIPVIGLTGTGGAGKSSLTDELLRRFLQDFPDRTFAIISVDPTKRRTGGALLGDRIRFNSCDNPRAYVRSLATRSSGVEVPEAIIGAIHEVSQDDFDLILLETSGIGQGDSRVTEISDLSVYVMTPEYGAASQLEKIDMIDFADAIVLNKSDRAGARDAIRDVRKQFRRSRKVFDHEIADESLPVFGTVASHFNDAGVEKFYRFLLSHLSQSEPSWEVPSSRLTVSGNDRTAVIPADRSGYLLDIIQTINDYHRKVIEQSHMARDIESLERSAEIVGGEAERSESLFKLKLWRALDCPAFHFRESKDRETLHVGCSLRISQAISRLRREYSHSAAEMSIQSGCLPVRGHQKKQMPDSTISVKAKKFTVCPRHLIRSHCTVRTPIADQTSMEKWARVESVFAVSTT